MAHHSKVLIVEDDPLIVELLKLGLEREHFETLVAVDGAAALEAFQSDRPDLVILDLMLPHLGGEEVCKRLRAHNDVPIIVLTARDDVSDKLKLFALGADDYVVKPFNLDELVARMGAVLRRRSQINNEELAFQDLAMRMDTREVLRDGRTIDLTAKEFDLLHFLMSNPRRVLTRDTILTQVWGPEYAGADNIVEVYVGYLRRKLGDPPLIQTVRGVGYSLRA